jgi:hypothetical protein
MLFVFEVEIKYRVCCLTAVVLLFEIFPQLKFRGACIAIGIRYFVKIVTINTS